MHPFDYAIAAPERTAIQMADGETSLTYAQLAERIRRIQNALYDHGVRQGEVVAIFCDNILDFLPFAWAAQSSGLYYTTVNSHLTAEEAAYIVNDCAAKVLLTSDHLAAVVDELTSEVIPGVSGRWMAGIASPTWDSFDAICAAAATDALADEREGGLFLYSSGTTGRPKGIKRPLPLVPLGADDINVVSFLTMLGIGAGDVYLSPAPLYHAAPIGVSMGIHRTGGTVIVMEKFDPERALQLIEHYRVACTQMVPTMFIRMLKLPEQVRTKYDLSSLRRVVHAAAPCPPDVKHAMIEWLGPIIDEYYAASEGPGTTFIGSADWLTHPGSVGRPLVGTPHVLDDDGNELGVGEDGTIWFEGSGQFEYHGDPDETAKTRNKDGWVTVGDIGHLDSDGFLYLSDRKAFMIISGGVNIYPQEIENALISHPLVMDAAVFGVPNPDFGEEVKAVVQPVDWSVRGPELVAELMAHCRARIAGYKCPRTIDFMQELPRLDTGKLYKRPLRDKYWTQAATTA